MYAKGRGVAKDDVEAFRWFYMAAEQGVIRAQLNIGGMYYAGEKREQDYAKAANWYRMAAEQGNALAQYNLGGMYANGQGVEHDYLWAYVWLSFSAEQDYSPSIIQLDRLREAMTAAQIALAEKELSNERAMEAENLGDRPYEPGKMDETPKIVYKVDPVFPSALNRKRVGGKVVVSYIVDEAGMVQYPRIDTSADYVLDFAVLDAIKKWRFTPGIHKGKIVKTRMRSVYSVQ
jgi:TonB family protein